MIPIGQALRRAGTRILFAVALALAPGPFAAAKPLSAADGATVARAEAALNRIRGIESRFVQTSSNGRVAHGTLYVERPGKLRIDYAPPTPLQVYADSFWLIYLDFELKEANQVPIGSTPAAFLVRDQLSFSGDLSVTGVSRGKDRLRLDIVRTDEPDAGRLGLELDAATLALLGWVVVDAQGIETRITLVDPVFNRPIDRKVFVYVPPDWAFGSEEAPN